MSSLNAHRVRLARDRPLARTVGLLGGIGPLATEIYYRRLTSRLRASGVRGEIVVFSLDFDRFTDLELHDTENCREEIIRGLWALERAGAEVIAMAANSAHIHLDGVRKALHAPVISLVDAVIAELQRRAAKSALLLGIPVTMRHGFYQTACAARGIRLDVPPVTADHLLDRIIFDELTNRRILPDSRRQLLELLRGRDVEALVLGCTELPALITTTHSPVPVIDSVALHVDAIVAAACGTIPSSGALS